MDISSLTNTFSDWGDTITNQLPNLLLAIGVFALFIIVGRIVRKIVRQIGHRISENQAISNLFGMIAYVSVLLIGVMSALRIMELDGAATSILAGAGIAGVAIGFAFQDIAANFISGVILAIQRPMKIGDLVETNGTYGNVKHINLRSTEIETLTGQFVHIPNQDILLNPLIDYSHKGTRRIDLSVGVAYSSKLDVAETAAIKAVKSLDAVLVKRPIDLYYTEFGDSSINFTLRFWIKFKNETDFLTARSQAIKAIKREFDTNNITIPFPMRTIEFSNQNMADKISK